MLILYTNSLCQKYGCALQREPISQVCLEKKRGGTTDYLHFRGWIRELLMILFCFVVPVNYRLHAAKDRTVIRSQRRTFLCKLAENKFHGIFSRISMWKHASEEN